MWGRISNWGWSINSLLLLLLYRRRILISKLILEGCLCSLRLIYVSLMWTQRSTLINNWGLLLLLYDRMLGKILLNRWSNTKRRRSYLLLWLWLLLIFIWGWNYLLVILNFHLTHRIENCWSWIAIIEVHWSWSSDWSGLGCFHLLLLLVLLLIELLLLLLLVIRVPQLLLCLVLLHLNSSSS